MLLSADRVLFPDSDAPVAGWVETAGDRIVATGTGAAPRVADEHLTGIVVPGYVDVHSHGGGGASFVTEDPDVARRALAAHRRLGVTTMVASLVTGTTADLTRQVACLAGLVESGELAGIHLEGPWLALEYKGAHPPLLLADPLPDAVAELLDAGRGAVRMVTIAPERAGAMESIRLMASRVSWRRSATPTPTTTRAGRRSTPARPAPPTCSTPWPPCATASRARCSRSGRTRGSTSS